MFFIFLLLPWHAEHSTVLYNEKSKLQLYPHQETLGRHPETAPWVPQWSLLIRVLSPKADSTEAHFPRPCPVPTGLKGRSSLQLALGLYLSQMVRELSSLASHTGVQRQILSGLQKVKRLSLGPMVTIVKGKVDGCPLSVSSRLLVLGTFLILSHGKESLFLSSL